MDWSNMLPEILEELASKYIVYYEDYPSFAVVCKSWHLAARRAAAKGNGPPSRLPSLMLSEKIGDGDKFRELFLLSNKTVRKIELPEVCGKICMSSCGWLATVEDDHSSHLINPFTRQKINLPNTETFPTFATPLIREYGFIRVVYLAELSLVVALWRSTREVAFCRIGEEKWNKALDGMILDIAYYGGEIYMCDVDFRIYAWDTTGTRKVTRLPKHVRDTYYDDEELELEGVGLYITVLDDGETKRLLVVLRKGTSDHDNDTYQTKCFQVWGYDLGETKGKWRRVNCFGTKSLFVGHSSSFWVEQDTTIKGNCIYFTDDVVESYRYYESGGGSDMGIFHLSDGTIEPHFTGESRSSLTPPIWLESM